MQQKSFKLINKGMNRDLSPSKVGESCVYDNRNIRITALDQDTLLSVTNEKGNKFACEVNGISVGVATLNEYLILFTHSYGDDLTDRIYRIKFGNNAAEISSSDIVQIYSGKLGFSNSIDSVTYFENDEIQKVYWVDGTNVLRCANIMKDYGTFSGDGIDDIFDVNKGIDFIFDVSVDLTSSGNSRPNGVVQYFITYFDKYGGESGVAWVSDLVYLSPDNIGGASDGHNSRAVRLTIDASQLGLDYTHFRVYSLFRSALDGQVVAYLVSEQETTSGIVTVVDDGAHLTVEDPQRLLYLGSLPVIADTICHKDGTLFLGNIKATGRETYDDIKDKIDESNVSVSFSYLEDVDYTDDSSLYPYNNQLNKTSFDILSFKANEKYRFALRFQYRDGTMTDAFWIADKNVGDMYPRVSVDDSGNIDRVVAEVAIPSSLTQWLIEKGICTAQVMIADPTDADRSVKAQGIINPTMFNVWERYNKRVYAMPSWISRPVQSDYAYEHYSSVNNSTISTGEVQCNYWEDAALACPCNGSGESFGDDADWNLIMAVYEIYRESASDAYVFTATVYTAYVDSGYESTVKSLDISSLQFSDPLYDDKGKYYEYVSTGYRIVVRVSTGHGHTFMGVNPSKSRPMAYNELKSKLYDKGQEAVCIDYDVLKDLCEDYIDGIGGGDKYFNLFYSESQQYASATIYSSFSDAENAGNKSVDRWESSEDAGVASGRYASAYYRKNLMYVDGNVITLDSPEIFYGSSVVDNAEYKLRLVGIAENTSVISDYTLLATNGRQSGSNLDVQSFSKISDGNNTVSGILSWPLWKDYGLVPKESGLDPKKATNADYSRGSLIVHYWLHMWHRAGSIDGWKDSDESTQFGIIDTKTFANERCAYKTEYFDTPVDITLSGNVRVVDGDSTNQVILNVDNEEVAYVAKPRIQLTMPGNVKYPILYSDSLPQSTDQPTESDDAYLYSSDPVTIEYSSSRHAVMTLPVANSGYYTPSILPIIAIGNDLEYIYDEASWIDNSKWPVKWVQSKIRPKNNYDDSYIVPENPYLFIGELYREFGSGDNDTRYGGTSDEAKRTCRYIAASDWSELTDGTSATITAYGDTYIQRWDALRIKPYSNDSVNKIIDITSAILETHINIDGRTDKQRGISEVASIDTAQYNSINPVYSQKNNFFVGRGVDADIDKNGYKNAITWTMQKKELAVTDEWMHITLANALFLDGDRGECTALHRYGNSLIAFQPEGISEILYNSRTQLSTNQGLPVEIANSGKVEGKSYITRKYGCKNKRSIAEGKKGLYFFDEYNKAFCVLSANSIDNISERLGFGVYMRNMEGTQTMTVVSDREYDDVYIIPKQANYDTLAYNEVLGTFTSFYSYSRIRGMRNCMTHFLAVFPDDYENKTSVWYQHEGLYCNFFGTQYDYSITYRVSPLPYGDKIWSSIDVKSDFYNAFLPSSTTPIEEDLLIDGGWEGPYRQGNYIPDEHFTKMEVWNEYQQAAVEDDNSNPVKKFRVWRYQFPRSIITDSNIYGDDRFRNPWMFIKFTKEVVDNGNRYLMQLHDVDVKYFE